MSEPTAAGRLLIGATGSIHVQYLPLYLLQIKQLLSCDVRVIMSRTAADMLPPWTLELYTEAPVLTDTRGNAEHPSPHIRWTRWADLLLILPATANIIGRAANGLADDLVSASILSSSCPVILAPAMNPAMWNAPVVKRNVAQLRSDGHHIVEPVTGVSVTSGKFDLGIGPTPELVIPLLALHMVAAAKRASASPAEDTAAVYAD